MKAKQEALKIITGFTFALLFLVLYSTDCRAATSDGRRYSAMKSTHNVNIEEYTDFSLFQAGDVIRIGRLGCHMNSDKFRHNEGFLHGAEIIWSGELYPDGNTLIVKVKPCNAKNPDWAKLEYFILVQDEGADFWATDFRQNTGDFSVSYDQDGQADIIWPEFSINAMSCHYLRVEGPFAMSSASISYNLLEAAQLGWICPAEGLVEARKPSVGSD